MTLIFKPAEESVLYDKWLSWLKNLALRCVQNAHLSMKVGRKHEAKEYWMVIILHALLNLSLEDASDCLNQILWDKANRHLCHKIHPKEHEGKYKRKERKCPNHNQTCKYRNSLPRWLVKGLNRYIFSQQIDYALEKNLIKKEIDILVDNTDQWYYGNDRYPENPFITKGHNGPGTSRKRKYLAIMLKSGTTSLYCGVDLMKKGHSNVPFILETIDWLKKKGFTVRYVIGDRWFPTFKLLQELLSRKIHYIGPYKKYPSIRRAIETYIKKGGNYIFSHVIHGSTALYYKHPGIHAWLILTNGQGRRLSDIRRGYLSGAKTLNESVKEIMVMMTTVAPPRGKKKRQGWAVQVCRVYKRRWQIETGFRDLNRITPPSNARTNTRKLFMCSVRYWVYNAWQLERAKRKKLRNCPQSWRKGPTLRRFTYCVIQLELRS